MFWVLKSLVSTQVSLGIGFSIEGGQKTGLLPVYGAEAEELYFEASNIPAVGQLRQTRAVIRAGGLRGATLLNYVNRSYVEWVKKPVWLVFQEVHSGKFKASLGAKRGNGVYAKRVDEALAELKEIPDHYFFNVKDRSKRHKTRAVFITLTYAHKRCSVCGLPYAAAVEICSKCGSKLSFVSIAEAWEGEKRLKKGAEGQDPVFSGHVPKCQCISCAWNRYINGLRKKYGKMAVFRVWEAQENGYPHLHAILFFKEKEFEVFHHNGAWRVHEKGELAEGWNCGFSDFEALGSVHGGIRYVAKYLGKVHGLALGYSAEAEEKHSYGGEGSNLGKLISNASINTLSLMWVFRKRSFALSGAFGEFIRAMHYSNGGGSGQVDLYGRVVSVKGERWVLKGFWCGVIGSWGVHGLRYPWRVDLSSGEFAELVASSSWVRFDPAKRKLRYNGDNFPVFRCPVCGQVWCSSAEAEGCGHDYVLGLVNGVEEVNEW